MTELEIRQKFVNTARGWLGLKEADGGTVTLQYLPHELVGHYFVFVRSLSE